MNSFDTLMVALRFNEKINKQDHDGLVSLMTTDHRLIDRDNTEHDNMILGWKKFFKNFPEYKNIFTRVQVTNNIVVMAGYASSNHPSLDGPFLWSAKVREDKVSEWRVYRDTPENRKKLRLA